MKKILGASVSAATVAAALVASAAIAEERVLVFSAYPTEQAKLLSEAAPVSEVGVFNGRRFFEGSIGGRSVVLGLTGIGMVNAAQAATEAIQYFEDNDLALRAIVFSGVAGGPSIGDVVIPDRWKDGDQFHPVDPVLYAATEGLDVELNPHLPVEDAACTGEHLDELRTPIRLTEDPQIRRGGFGVSSDPFGGRAVPCLSHAGGLLGCEACGAPLNTSPGVERFVADALPFFNPQFYFDLFGSFSGGSGSGAVVGDMETSAVARVAQANDIPFIAFRAVSDGGGDPLPPTAIIGFPVQFAVYQQLAADNAAAVTIEFLNEAW